MSIKRRVGGFRNVNNFKTAIFFYCGGLETLPTIIPDGPNNRRLTDCAVQFCFAHLIPDIRYLQEHSSHYTRGWSTRLLNSIREMFGMVHRHEDIRDCFDGKLEDASIQELTYATNGVPKDKKGENLAKRFSDYGESYLKSLTTPDLEPTNNLAEHAIRFVVMDRKVHRVAKVKRGSDG